MARGEMFNSTRSELPFDHRISLKKRTRYEHVRSPFIHGTFVKTTTKRQLQYTHFMRKSITVPLISLLLLLSGITAADSKFTQQKSASGFSSHFFTSLGWTSWRNFNDGTLTSVVEDALQSGVPSTFTFQPSNENAMVSGVGIRATEQLSFEINVNQLPQANYSVGSPFQDENSDFVDESSTLGWNARLAVEYAIPLGNWGLKATTRAGISQSKIRVVGTRKSTEPGRTATPITARTSTQWRDPFLGIGMRVPIPGKNDNWEVSVTFTHVFTDEESVNQALNAQLVYNFK